MTRKEEGSEICNEPCHCNDHFHGLKIKQFNEEKMSIEEIFKINSRACAHFNDKETINRGHPYLSGVIRYVGKVPEMNENNNDNDNESKNNNDNEIWFGIELDDPCGNTNGTLNNIQYFQCLNTNDSKRRGLFVNQSHLIPCC